MAKTKRQSKPKELTKEYLIQALQVSMTDEQWALVDKLRGHPVKPTLTARFNLLSNLFRKVGRKHSTNRDAAQDLQKEACKLYSILTGLSWSSSRDDSAHIKPRQSGQAGADVVLSDHARELLDKVGFPANCECKNTKDWDLQRAIIQARANTPKGQNWLIILKRRSELKKDRIDPVVVMDLEVFKRLIAACLAS